MSERSNFLEPITRENAAVVLVDHQVGLLSGVRDVPVGELKHNTVALARAATVLGIPVGTVKSRVFYGLRALKLALEERGVTT